MMCLRDSPWLLTRTSPLAPPQFSLVVTTMSFLFQPYFLMAAPMTTSLWPAA